MNNTFPFAQSPIIVPVVTQPVAKKDEMFKDTNFIRDPRLTKAFELTKLAHANSYKPVVDVKLKFKYPENSLDLLQYKKYKDFTKDELKDKYINEIYDEMCDKVINNVPAEEIKRIQGAFVNDSLNNVGSLLYKPVYSSIDVSTNKYIFNNMILDGKYEPYDGSHNHTYEKK